MIGDPDSWARWVITPPTVEPPFDAGGVLAPGFTTVPASTLTPDPPLSPGQIRAFERAAELVRRWETRGGESDTTHG
jgi:hypothetical protein